MAPAEQTSVPGTSVAKEDLEAAIVPADDADLYNDSDLPEGISENASSTDSLRSSILDYKYENGRRYHAYREGEYVLPNDEREQDRMDLQHHIFRLVLRGELYRAPISKDVTRILDLGTGTGIWAIEMADEFPSATVIGTDLSPIQPGWVPPNCSFEIDDFESAWNFSRPFDFVHGRSLEGSVSDHTKFLEQALKCLKPGGWLELADCMIELFTDDDTIKKAPHMREWIDLVVEASKKFGKPMGVANQYKGWMEDAGFKNIKEEIFKAPLNPWAKDRHLKELGRYQEVLMLEGMEAYTIALLTRVLGWSSQDVHLLLTGVRKELSDRTIHIYARYYFVYGQKPEEE